MRDEKAHEQDETVHERVKRLLDRTRMSQAEFAAATGDKVSESWIQKFLAQPPQPKYPTRAQLEPLVDALNTRLEPPTSLSYVMAPMGVVPIEEARGRDWGPLVDIDNTLPTDVRETIRRLSDTARKIYEDDPGKDR